MAEIVLTHGNELEAGTGWMFADPGTQRFLIAYVDASAALVVATADLMHKRVLNEADRYVSPDLVAVDDAGGRVIYPVRSKPSDSSDDSKQVVCVHDVTRRKNRYHNWITDGYQLLWLFEYLPGKQSVVGHLNLVFEGHISYDDFKADILVASVDRGEHARYRLPPRLWVALAVGPDEHHLVYRGNKDLTVVDIQGRAVRSIEEPRRPHGVSFFRESSQILIGGAPLKQWDLGSGAVTPLFVEGYEPFWSDVHQRLWYLCPSTALHLREIDTGHEEAVVRLLGDWDHSSFNRTAIVPSADHSLLFVRLGGNRPITDPARLAAERARVGDELFESCPAYSLENVEIDLVVDPARRQITPLPLKTPWTTKIITGELARSFKFD